MKEQILDRHFYFDAETPVAVRNVICNAYIDRRRVRIYVGETATGGSWLEENRTMGRIGRSMGVKPVPLLIASTRSFGGCAISTGAIVAIQDAKTKAWLYKHESFYVPALTVKPFKGATFKWAVYKREELQACFYTEAKAKNYVSFMRGERMKVA